ncbi:ATP-binding cassette sub- A member 5, partial [Rhizophlyctis rosea]
NLTLRGFANDIDLTTFYTQNPRTLYAGILFNAPSYTTYTLRLNASIVPTRSDPDATDKTTCRSTDPYRFNPCTPDKYLYSGTLGLQSLLNSAIIQHHQSLNPSLNQTPITIFPTAQQIPLEQEEITTGIQAGLEEQNAIWLVVALSFPLTYLLTHVAEEKERKIKEGMMMMGLRPAAFWAGWMVTYMGITLFVTVIVLIVTIAIKVFQYSNAFLILLIMYSYTLSTIALSFPITAFFNKAKMANLIGPFLTLVPSLLYLPIKQANLSPLIHGLLAIFLSPMGMSLAMSRATTLEIKSTGLQFSNLVSSGVIYPFIGILLSIVFYSFLGWYLDQVVPSEYGVKKPWWFIFGGRKAGRRGRVGEED